MAVKVLITGASGMIGGLLLERCSRDERVSEVISLVRRPSAKTLPKVKELVVADFMNYESCRPFLNDISIVFYCLGVYTGAVPPAEFRRITVDFPLTLAKLLKETSPTLRFCLLSGQGADRSGKSNLMFARDKGVIENELAALGFSSFHSFRPGYIYPVVPRKEPNFTYRLMRFLYPLVKLMGKKYSITSVELANAMFFTGVKGCEKEVLENSDIADCSRKADAEIR